MLSPTRDFVVVKPLQRIQSSIIEVVSEEKSCRGEVVAVGPGKENKKGIQIPLDVRVGEIVIFGDGNFDFYPKYFEEGTETCFRIIQEGDIVGILEEPDTKH